MVHVKVLSLSCLIALGATSASAATYTFDLQTVGSYVSPGDAGTIVDNTLTIDQAGDSGSLTGTFTGKYFVAPSYDGNTLTGGVFSANSVQRHNTGLGVCNTGPCSPSGDAHHTVDGTSTTEAGLITDFVEMSFFSGLDAVDVTLKSLSFGWVGSVYNQYTDTNGLFEVLVSELSDTMIGAEALRILPGEAVATPGTVGGLDTVLMPELAAFTDNIFGVKAGIAGSWKLLAVTVDYSVPEVPLPAAGWLMLAGLGGIAALRRRKA